jgi:hypothetical protein
MTPVMEGVPPGFPGGFPVLFAPTAPLAARCTGNSVVQKHDIVMRAPAFADGLPYLADDRP